MKLFVMALLMVSTSILAAPNSIRFDNDESQRWQIVNDSVMGGLSRSRFVVDTEENIAVFEGILSLENNGGFASCRRTSAPKFYAGGTIKLRVKGDGRRYQFRVRTPYLNWGAAYVAEFNTTQGEWVDILLNEEDFNPRWRGRLISGAPKLNFGDIKQLGILLGDKTPGRFKIKLESIQSLQTL